MIHDHLQSGQYWIFLSLYGEPPHPVVKHICMIYGVQLDTHSVIEMIPVYKYEFSPEMISQSSLSQPESAGSAF